MGMSCLIALLLLLAPDEAPPVSATEKAISAAFAANDIDALDALGWEAVAALPADSEWGKRLEAHVLTTGLKARAHAPRGYVVLLGPAPAVEPTAVSLEWESGSGHGFTLTRYRARWSAEGLRVRRMHYFRNVRTDKKEGVLTESTVIPHRRAEVVLRAVLAASALGLKAPERNLSHMTSSGNFHLLLRVHNDRTVVFKHFTGYRGTSGAPRYVGLSVCNSLLREALAPCTWKEEHPNEDDLANLAQRLSTLATESWWVRERLILMAGAVGDKRCLPELEAQIRRELDSTMRAHKYAIDAYARISGVDLRPREFSTAEVPATRAKYLADFESR
jgi:hypothetical protein